MSTQKENFKYAICYIPLVAIFLYFTEKNTSEEYKKHIKYGITLFIIFIISTSVLNILWLSWFSKLILIAYIIISGLLGYKIYNGEKVDVEILDNIGEKFENKK
ncbi:MAG: hypothetical protein Q9M94_06850 [Candidatus Gracilibacteria bacterium]|nr:hypothetical protein [Candidatus Gracilibacteria bacterium]